MVAGPVIRVFDLPLNLKAQLHEDARAWLQRGVADAGHYMGHYYKALRKSSHRGPEKSPHAPSQTLQCLKEIAALTGRSLDEIEAGITALHGGIVEHQLLAPFPKQLNEDWAWLVGLYASAGAGMQRERQVRFRVDLDVAPAVQARLLRIGCFSTLTPQPGAHGRRKAILLMPRPFHAALATIGIPMEGEKLGPGRGRAARHERIQVPDWCLSTATRRHAFVEGFLNGRIQCTWSHYENRGNHVRYARLRIGIVCRDATSREQLADLVEQELRAVGCESLKRHPGRNGRETSIHVVSHRDFTAAVRGFHLHRTKVQTAIQAGGKK